MATGNLTTVFAAVLLAAAVVGCERNDMHNQPRHEPMEPSAFFADGQSSRLPIGRVLAEADQPIDIHWVE